MVSMMPSFRRQTRNIKIFARNIYCFALTAELLTFHIFYLLAPYLRAANFLCLFHTSVILSLCCFDANFYLGTLIHALFLHIFKWWDIIYNARLKNDDLHFMLSRRLVALARRYFDKVIRAVIILIFIGISLLWLAMVEFPAIQSRWWEMPRFLSFATFFKRHLRHMLHLIFPPLYFSTLVAPLRATATFRFCHMISMICDAFE